MPVIETAIKTIVAFGVREGAKKAARTEAVIRVLTRLGLTPDLPPDNFNDVYTYTLVEYGIDKPQPVLEFFRNKYIRDAYFQSFAKRDPTILDREAESLIEWHEVGDDLRRMDINPRTEFARFTAKFNEIVSRTRTPKEIRVDHKLDDIHVAVVETSLSHRVRLQEIKDLLTRLPREIANFSATDVGAEALFACESESASTPGFAVNNSGLLICSSLVHPITKARHLTSGEEYDVTLIERRTTLQAVRVNSSTRGLTLSLDSRFLVGQEIYAFNSRGERYPSKVMGMAEWVFSPGMGMEIRHIYITDLAPEEDSSGGPITNAANEVVGLVLASSPGYCLYVKPWPTLEQFLELEGFVPKSLSH